MRSARLMVVEIFKKTPRVPDSKPAGRYVAKDMSKTAGIALQMNTLPDHDNLQGACFAPTGAVLAGNLNGKQSFDHAANRCVDAPVASGTVDVNLSGEKRAARRTKGHPRATDQVSGLLWKYAQQVGTARHGASTGGAHEKLCHADI